MERFCLEELTTQEKTTGKLDSKSTSSVLKTVCFHSNQKQVEQWIDLKRVETRGYDIEIDDT